MSIRRAARRSDKEHRVAKEFAVGVRAATHAQSPVGTPLFYVFVAWLPPRRYPSVMSITIRYCSA